MKILLFKIDNTPLPKNVREEVQVLDCRQINDFCSFVGDALVGNLKDSNGTPLYRLLIAGNLLKDFEQTDLESYNQIIDQWLNILDEILQKGITRCDNQFTINFPNKYIEWLLNNENDYYIKIGKNLLTNNGKIYLDAEGISEDIISALDMKINRVLHEKDDVKYIVFSNERIGNSSNVVFRLRSVFTMYSFLRINQWINILEEEQQLRIKQLDDIRAFWLDDLKLGVTTKVDIPQQSKNYYKQFHLEFKKEGRLSRQWTQPQTDSVNIILSILFGESKDWKELSYNNVAPYLIQQRGFVVSLAPNRNWYSHSGGGYRYSIKLRRDTDEYFCEVEFLHWGKYMEISDFK